MTETVLMREGEKWWGVANFFGLKMPFTKESELTIDLRKDNFSNQSASLLLSNLGRLVWSETQACFTFEAGTIRVESASEIWVEQAGTSLPEAYRAAMQRWFPPSGKMPDPLFFSAPQINTWIELTYHQNEKDILGYAQSMVDHGVPAGVLMIDDTWQAGYGDWRFEPTRFPDPKGMMEKLHAMGYKVMLWMCPYVGMDLPAFRRIAWGINPDDVKGYPQRGGFFTQKGAAPTAYGCVPAKACEWWNGFSAFLDFSHPNANAWFTETLDGLVNELGVDGFKLDGGDVGAYDLSDRDAFDPTITNGALNNRYASYALRYPFCEIRSLWRLQQMPVVVRLHDKGHTYEALHQVVADMIAAGLLGQPFICPDMVGGGSWEAFMPGAPFDPELFVRSAQVHALCPMMQISASPWRVLGEEHQRIIQDIIALRQSFVPLFLELAEQAAKTGEPMLRSLEYNYPHQGYSEVRDQFMMGDRLLVAPQLEKGASSRAVVLPPGTWIADDGAVAQGPQTLTVETPLARLPYFRLMDGTR